MSDIEWYQLEPETLPEDGSYLFRYDDGTPLHLSAYKVIRETPKGKWISMWFGKDRFVRNNGRKRFAHETREAARASYLYRKHYQIRILKERLQYSEMYYRMAGGEEDVKDIYPFRKNLDLYDY
jgi:hypothetical protein